MANRDIIVLNTTQSRAETQQTSDTVRIKGGGEILSVENSSASPILTIQSSGSQTTLSGSITSTGNLTGVTTGSFGKVEATTLIGSAFELTNSAKLGTLSASSQIASKITGSFRQGFEFTGTISGSGVSTGSFDKIIATTFVGDANNLGKSSELPNTVSASSTIAADISGSFNKGFEYAGTIKRTLGTWSATNPVNKARQQATAFGSQNSTVLAGGNVDPKNESETWNGTNWSEGNNLTTGRHAHASAGTATAGLIFGGAGTSGPNNKNETETYDGTDYSEVNNLTTGRYALGGFGTQNSAIAAGGAVSEYNNICKITECWNGTNWSEVNDMNNPKWYFGSAGDSSESGIIFGGSYASPAFSTGIAETEEWNGTSWSEVGDLNVNLLYTRGQGSTNNAIVAGGLINSPTNTFSTCTETWDGTSWSIDASLNVAGRYLGIGGNGDGAIAGGWSVPASPYTATNSELFQATLTTGSFGRVDATTLVGSAANLTNADKTNTITSSAQLASRISGSFNKGFEFDGEISGSMSVSASFNTLTANTLVGDGSALTNTIPTGTVTGSAQLASRISGSFNKGFEFTGTIEKAPAAWSSITTTNANIQDWGNRAAGNSVNSFIAVGGRGVHPGASEAYSWNGSAWSSGEASMIKGRDSGNFVGTTEAAIYTGGRVAPGYNSGPSTAETEVYNGSSFSECGDMITNRASHISAGTVNAAIVVGGSSGSNAHAYDALTTQTYNSIVPGSEKYPGTAWEESHDPIMPRVGMSYGDGGGSQDSLLAHGGVPPGNAGDYTGPGINSPGTYTWPAGNYWAAGFMEEYNGSSWTAVYQNGSGGNAPNFWAVNGAFVGTVNAATIGMGANFGQAGGNYNKAHADWDGTTFSVGTSLPDLGYGKNQGTLAGQGGAGAGKVAFGNISNYAGVCAYEYEVFYSTGSFGKVIASEFVGSGSNITNVAVPSGVVSSSAQLASKISGSFNHGFEFSSGNISGSSTSTGSFGRLVATRFSTGSISELTNTALPGTISSSAQIASQISGSWNMGFQYKCQIHSQLGSWSVGGNLIAARTRTAGFGTQAGMIVAGGTSPVAPSTNAPSYGRVACVESYNGSSWSEVSNINTSREGMMSAGTPTAGIIYGGGVASPSAVSCVEEYNGAGDTWSEVTNMNENRKHSGDAGDTSEAVLQFGGEFASPAHYTETAEQYNGTNWSEINFMILGKTNVAGLGNTEAALAVGGNPNPGGHAPQNDRDVEEWNGVNWTAIGYTLEQSSESYINRNASGAGTVNDAHVFGGWYQYYRNPTVPSYIYCYDARSQHYDGISWSYGGRLITGRLDGGGDGTSGANGIFAGGGNPSSPTGTTNTEEYNSFYATASFGSVIANCLIGDACKLDNISFPVGTITSSAQIADNISGSIQGGFEFTNEIRSAKGVWSTGGGLNLARRELAGSGTQNAALATGGSCINPSYPFPPFTPMAYTECSEEYNGSAWSEGNDVITPRKKHSQVGTQNASLLYGGWNTAANTEEYNGTTYATSGNLSCGRYSMIGFGHQNAAFAAAGTVSNKNGITNSAEQYDGAAWTNSVSMIQARFYGGAGTQNAGIAGYGQAGNNNNASKRALNCTELWNGTSWSESVEAITSGENGVSYGTQNAFVITAGCAGTHPNLVASKTTQFFDGISYSMDADLVFAGKQRGGGRTTQNSGIVFGGYGPETSNFMVPYTEEYNAYYTTGSFGRIETPDVQLGGDSQLVVSASLQLPVFATNDGIISSSAGQMWFNSTTRKLNFTMDVNSWSAAGNMILARHYHAGAGTQNAAIAAGGLTPSVTAETELYDGSAWSVAGSEAHDLDKARLQFAMTGNQNSALAFGGRTNSPTPGLAHNETETFNGSAWTEVNNLNTSRHDHAGFGTQNAAVASAGKTPSGLLNDTEEWNGTNWTAAADNNTTRNSHTGAGNQNSGIIFGGNTNPAMSKLTETYDGTSWTEVNDMNIARNYFGGAGTQNAGVAFGGDTGDSPFSYACTEEWNGTSWSVANVLPIGVRNIPGGGAGSQASAIAFGGFDSEVANQSYEYSVSHLKTVEIDGV